MPITTRIAGLLMAGLLAVAGAPAIAVLHAQQIDAHLSYVPGDEGTHYPLVGGGVGVRLMFDARSVFIGTRLGADYAREEHLGPGRGTIGMDLTLSPHRDMSSFVPYAGVGVAMNWSGGKQPAWSGVRAGIDGIVGVDIAMFGTNVLGLKLEERYGKITELPATFSSRVGFIVGF